MSGDMAKALRVSAAVLSGAVLVASTVAALGDAGASGKSASHACRFGAATLCAPGWVAVQIEKRNGADWVPFATFWEPGSLAGNKWTAKLLRAFEHGQGAFRWQTYSRGVELGHGSIAAPRHAKGAAKEGMWVAAGPWLYGVARAGLVAAGAISFCSAKGEYVFVDIAARNAGKKAHHLYQSMFRLVSPSGVLFSPSGCATMVANLSGHGMLGDTVNPGEIEDSNVIFDVPVGTDLSTMSLRAASASYDASTFAVIRLKR